jgi:hypothetical protein
MCWSAARNAAALRRAKWRLHESLRHHPPLRTQVLDRSGDPRSALLQIRLLLFHLADAADFGFQRGFQDGHKAASDWLVNLDHEVTRMQKTIQDEEKQP